MSRVTGVKRGLAGVGLSLLLGLAMLAGSLLIVPAAGAADGAWQDDAAHWLCRPGDTPDPCAGSLDGKLTNPEIDLPGTPLGYRVNPDPKVDCFYVYPTQSEQATPNADWSKDSELLRPTINQAAQFSRRCRVFAPMYRQYTQWALGHPEVITDAVRDLAYNDLIDAWNTYLQKYNQGRGVIVIAHSQGTSHMARLMAAEVDGNAAVRKQIIGAYLLGANVYVPKGKLVGGQFQHMPACTSGDETGCIVAYSTFLNRPAADSMFGRVDVGYWVNPNPRPDSAKYEVMCVNPAGFNGDAGQVRVMANLTAFLTPGAPQPASPWTRYDGFYTTACKNEDGASWLQGEPVPGKSSPQLDLLLSQAGSSNDGNPYGNLHLADVNLALDNLVALAGTQSDAWLKQQAQERESQTRARQLATLRKQLKQKQRQLKRTTATVRKLTRQVRRAKGKRKRALRRKLKANRKKQAAQRRQIKSLRKRIARLQKS